MTEWLTDTLDLSDGALFAHLPLGLTLEDLSIAALQKVKGSTYDMYSPLIELTRRHLEENDAVWIVPDVMLYKDEVDRKTYAPLTLTYKDEVYHALTDYPTSDDVVRQMLWVAEHWQYIGVLTRAAKLRGRTGKAELSLNDIDMLAANAETIIYDPFDGEGYAIWQREKA